MGNDDAMRAEVHATIVAHDNDPALDAPVRGLARVVDDQMARKKLWLAHHGSEPGALYGDDGEMQCNVCQLDFRRAPWSVLVARSVSLMLRDWRRGVARAKAETCPQDVVRLVDYQEALGLIARVARQDGSIHRVKGMAINALEGRMTLVREAANEIGIEHP